jgi:hypothetical protein
VRAARKESVICTAAHRGAIGRELVDAHVARPCGLSAGGSRGRTGERRRADGGRISWPHLASGGGLSAGESRGRTMASGGAALVALQLSYVDLRVIQLQVSGVGFVVGVLSAGRHARQHDREC